MSSFRSWHQTLVSGAIPAVISFALSLGHAAADNGTWTGTSDGLWSDSANWASGTIADGAGFGADFSTIDPTASILVDLDSPRTLSNLVFGDTDTATAADWLLGDNGDPLNVLTLDGTATINVNTLGDESFTEISTVIAGTAGITKEGPGMLVLSGANSFIDASDVDGDLNTTEMISTYSGPTTVNGGTLVQRNFVLVNSACSIASGASLEFADTSNINMPGGSFTGGGTLVKSGGGNLALGFNNYVPVQVSLSAGALVHVKEGTLSGSSYNMGNWSANQANLQIDAGATFDTVENDAVVDAVTGAGNLTGNYFSDPQKIVVGVANGGGTFTGALYDSRGVAFGLTKEGSGTQIFSGTANHSGTTTVNGGTLGLPGFSNSPLYAIAAGSTLEINCAVNQDRNIKNLLINGGGNLVKKGTGLLRVNRWQNESDRSYEIALAGTSEIRVEAGELLLGDYNISWKTSSNLADLHIETGAIVDGHTAGMTVDALTGGGIYESGYFGPRALTVGVNGGSGTFSGTIRGNGLDGNSQTRFIKRGNGTQTLTGTFNASGRYGESSLIVRDGVAGSPSTLVISPSDPASSAGYTGGGIYFSVSNTDVTAVQHTAGTLVGSILAVGEHAGCTYDFTGGTVNVGRLEFAWNGGGNNLPAVMNISGNAAMNIHNNGNILMGQYWGRNVTINQTGGSVIQYSDAGTTRGGTGKLRFFGSNQNLTWNLSGGTLSIAGMERAAAGGGYGGGNGILNLNGGILQITSAAFAAPTGDANDKPVVAARVLGDDATPNSGARFDPYGLAVTFAAPVQHGSTSAFDGGLSVESSLPGGSLTLTGINSYTGDTTVAADNTFALADNAELSILVIGSDATKITGAGTATFAGDLRIDTTLADTTPGTTWTLVDVVTRSFDPVTFQVIGFTEAADVWTKTDGGNLWTFTESTGELKVTTAVAGGYANWIDDFTVSDPAPGADPENDGVENLMEYVLNGNPSLSDPVILPDLDASGENFVFQFTRREESAGDTTQVFEYGTDLTGWTPLSITAPTAEQVSLGTPTAGLQLVKVTIPKTLAAPGGTLFGRLMVVKQP